jgi:hypothetical protein
VNFTGKNMKTRIMKNKFSRERTGISKILERRKRDINKNKIENRVNTYDADVNGSNCSGKYKRAIVGGYTCGVKRPGPAT